MNTILRTVLGCSSYDLEQMYKVVDCFSIDFEFFYRYYKGQTFNFNTIMYGLFEHALIKALNGDKAKAQQLIESGKVKISCNYADSSITVLGVEISYFATLKSHVSKL